MCLGSSCMLLMVLVRDVLASQLGQCEQQRQMFLASALDEGTLLLEASVGNSGSLMMLDVPSIDDAVDLLQGDPLALLSTNVQIRPLVINTLGFGPSINGLGYRAPKLGRSDGVAERKQVKKDALTKMKRRNQLRT